jgi:hypothetical protein
MTVDKVANPTSSLTQTQDLRLSQILRLELCYSCVLCAGNRAIYDSKQELRTHVWMCGRNFLVNDFENDQGLLECDPSECKSHTQRSSPYAINGNAYILHFREINSRSLYKIGDEAK